MDKIFLRACYDVLPILAGLLVWLIFLIIKLPFEPFKIEYVQVLLMAAPLWIIPLIIKRLSKVEINLIPIVSAAILLAISFLFPSGTIAGALTVPWMFAVVYLAYKHAMYFLIEEERNLGNILGLSSYLFMPVAAVWAFMHRAGIPFLGFDETIILLTVVHFHYAGFVLTTMASQILDQCDKAIAKLFGFGVLLGIPLLAVGITATHFELPIWIESIAAVVMSTSAFGFGVMHLMMGLRRSEGFRRGLFVFAGCALMVGMGLAFCYGMRPFFNISFLSIPFMYAVHGTCNAIGFAIPGTLAWVLK